MKSTIFLMFTFFMGIMYTFSQTSTVSVFTQEGEGIWVIVDGEKQNADPKTKVVVSNLTAPNYKFKIIFQDSKIPSIDKNIFTKDVDNNFHNSTYVVRKDNKGNYVMKLNSDEIVSGIPPAASAYQPGNEQGQVNTQTYQQTTTTTTIGDPQNVNVGIGINVNETPNGVNMNVNMGGVNTTGTVTSSYTTTTTTVSTNGSQDHYENHEHHGSHPYVMPGYSGAIGCPMPISNESFIAAKNSISSKSFDDSKLTIAKQVIANNCLLCSHVKEIMLLFSFEDTKLELAKFAYKHTYDIGNYYQLNDAFSFESSIDDLNKYVSNGGY